MLKNAKYLQLNRENLFMLRSRFYSFNFSLFAEDIAK